jgi:hypothetical protein
MVRLRKLPNEMFGRSFAMDALPTLRELNVLRKGYSSALGKILNPPMGYLHDMIGGAGVLDRRAMADRPRDRADAGGDEP